MHNDTRPSPAPRDYAELYRLTMEDAEAFILPLLGRPVTQEDLDAMESRICKGVESGLGECWTAVMRAACEGAVDEYKSELEHQDGE